MSHRRFFVSRVSATLRWLGPLLLTVVTQCPMAVTSVGFDGIPGDYCKIRQPVQCCVNRDDDCAVAILGNHLCYCDLFCRTHPGNDCCPDFADVCEGAVATTISAPHQDFKDCTDDSGLSYPAGVPFKRNCHTCSCDSTGKRKCDHVACIIQEDVLDQVDKGQHSWRPSNYSDFWGKILDDGIRYRLGTLYPERTVENMNEILIEIDPNLPDRFDAREKWPSYIHPVRNQMNCGSSWAYSTTAVCSDRLAIQSKGKFNVVLSPQLLISCNQHRQKGCYGGYLDRAWWYIRKIGAVSETCYKYDSGNTNDPGPCLIPKSQYKSDGSVDCPSGSSENRVYKMTPPYRISSKEEDIMTEIYVNGPVQATFLVHEDFYMYKSGVYQHLDLARDKGSSFRKSGYHSVRILGWGVEPGPDGRAVKYWLCDNSWGNEWGENGYFRILRGENHCEIESFILGAWGKGSKRKRRLRRRRARKLLKM